ncbi:MAG: hypothetical protein ACO21Q_09005, partial [Burkholderiaceae bacterium]
PSLKTVQPSLTNTPAPNTSSSLPSQTGISKLDSTRHPLGSTFTPTPGAPSTTTPDAKDQKTDPSLKTVQPSLTNTPAPNTFSSLPSQTGISKKDESTRHPQITNAPNTKTDLPTQTPAVKQTDPPHLPTTPPRPLGVVTLTYGPGVTPKPGGQTPPPISYLTVSPSETAAPKPTNPPTVHFGSGEPKPGDQWSIQRSTANHEYSEQHYSAAGEWGVATINNKGDVNYIQDPNNIKNHRVNSGDTTSVTTQTVHSSGGSGGAVNPGGHLLTNNGAVNGKAWWKHLNPETGQEIIEEIESRSHNEFYDVFKDGIYVGTYQMSANAVCYSRSAWVETRTNPGHHVMGTTIHPGFEEWQISDVHLGQLAPGSAQSTGASSS